MAESLGDFDRNRVHRNSATLWQFRCFRQGGVAAQEGCDGLRLKALPGGRFCRWVFCVSGTYGRLLHVLGGGQHGLRTIGEAVYLLRFRGTLLVAVECCVNAAQHRFQRQASFFPSLNQRPVERREQQASATTMQESFFNLSEVVEVIFHGGSAGGTGCWR